MKKTFGKITHIENAISNEEFINLIDRAKEAHHLWIGKLNSMVEKMKIIPLQTNDKRCEFGHFYHALSIDNTVIAKEWESIAQYHKIVHETGKKVMDSIKNNNQESAKMAYSEAEIASEALCAVFNDIKMKLEDATLKGVSVF